MGHPFRIGLKLAGQDTTAEALREVWRIADDGGFDQIVMLPAPEAVRVAGRLAEVLPDIRKLAPAA